MPLYSSVRSSFGALGKSKYFVKPNVVTTNRILALDPLDPSSYPGTGNIWYDVSGNLNQANLINGPTWNPSGWFTLTNSSSPQYFILNNNLIPQIGLGDVSYSLESWVYASSLPGQTLSGVVPEGTVVAAWNMIGHDSATGIGHQMIGNASSSYNINFGARSTSNWTATELNLNLNNWYHIVSVRQAPSVNNYIYINGILISTYQPTFLTVLDPGSANLQIGFSGNRIPGIFDGRIGYTALYNTHLDSTQVVQNFNALRGRFGI